MDKIHDWAKHAQNRDAAKNKSSGRGHSTMRVSPVQLAPTVFTGKLGRARIEIRRGRGYAHMIITNAQLLDRFDKRQKHFIMSSSRNGGRSSPAVVGRVVYVGGGNSIYALNATNGAKLWSYTIGGEVESSPAVANGVVYAGSDDGNIYAFGTTSQSSNTLLIAIGVVVAVVIIAAVVFLMFQKRLKTKRTSPPPTP